jgi:hypothetical protein
MANLSTEVQNLSTEAVSKYHGLLQSSPDLIKRSQEQLTAKLKSVDFVFGGRPLCPYLRPHFVERKQFDRITSICHTFWGSVLKVGDLAIESRELQDYLGVTEIERELIAIDPKFSGVSRLSRLDSFLTENAYQFVELNAETPAGVAYADVASEIFAEIEVMQEFSREYRLSQLTGRPELLKVLLAAWKEFSGGAKKPQIGIIDYKGLPTQREFELCKEYFEKQGYKTVIADPRELEFTNGRLRSGDFEIDVVYKRVLVNEYLEKADACKNFFDAYKAGAVCMVNSFRGKLVHKKLLFGVLTDERFEHFFSREEKELIGRTVPWTRRMEERNTQIDGKEIDLVDFVRRNNDKLVLKPNDDYGGHGIFIGWNCSASEWESAIESSLKNGDYLVQRRVTTSREVFPQIKEDGTVEFIDQLVDLDPMLYDGKVGCAFTRLSSTELANVTAGGGMVPVFIIEGKN